MLRDNYSESISDRERQYGVRERERERPCGCIVREKGKAAEGCFGGAERVGGVLDE